MQWWLGSKLGFDCTRAFPREEKDDRVAYKKVSLEKYDIAFADAHKQERNR